MSFTYWIDVIFQNKSIIKITPYVSTCKDFFHLRTILRYVAIPANERYVISIIIISLVLCVINVRSTARHAIHLQFDISANAFEIRAYKVQSV
jgi:hypothetical protein